MDNATPTLEQALTEARNSLLLDSDHDLQPHFRWEIFRCLLDTSIADAARRRGAQIVVESERLSTVQVLPLWEVASPDDRRPQRLLDEVGTFFNSAWNIENAEALYRKSPFDYEDSPVYFVLSSAIHLLGLAILLFKRPQECFRRPFYKNLSNRELEFPNGWDSCYCASVAFAGGVTWLPGSDNRKRLAFWEWWLNVAIPKALQIGTET